MLMLSILFLSAGSVVLHPWDAYEPRLAAPGTHSFDAEDVRRGERRGDARGAEAATRPEGHAA